VYDFGDYWEHVILVENITDDKLLNAVYVNGEGNCPPEDCGGPGGYENLKRILRDPKNPEHKGMKQWLGLAKNKIFDAYSFDEEKVRFIVPAV
jgi:hypothetical protein